MLVHLEQNILLMERYLDFEMEQRRMGVQGINRQAKAIRRELGNFMCLGR